MAPKVDSLNIVSNTKPLSVVSKPEINSKIEVFENKNTKVNIDEVSFLKANSNAERKEKADTNKKRLIGIGIALGTFAIGVTSCLLLKKINGQRFLKEKAKIIESFRVSAKGDKKVLSGLLNENSLEITKKFVNEADMSNGLYIKFLDVLKRREHTSNTISLVMEPKTRLTEKIINSLEFKNFDTIKTIKIEDIAKLPIEEQKSFINSFISINYRGGSKKFVDNLPDFEVFRRFKEIEFPKSPIDQFDKIKMAEFQAKKLTYERNVEAIYDDFLETLLGNISNKNKCSVPHTPLKINTGCILDIKPPLTNSLAQIPTKETISYGHKVRVGILPENGKYMIHNMGESYLSRLEALLLTDPDAILCTGYKGGIGCLKNKDLMGIIVSPKSMKDLMIQASGDMSSGYGASKNLYNIQNMFLEAENTSNNYIPNLIRNKLNINIKEYNKRIEKLGNIHYLEEIKSIDKELYEVVQSITSTEKMFEGIMRPNIEGICLPKGTEISKRIAKFAEDFQIPILYMN